MGLLVNGKWVDAWYNAAATGGRFMRSQAQFRRLGHGQRRERRPHG